MLKRLFRPHITQNEKEVDYSLVSLSSTEVEELLSTRLVGGGVFGIESIINTENDNTVFFCQPHFKTKWETTQRNSIFNDLLIDDKYTTYAEFYLSKPSIFPIEMSINESFINKLKQYIPMGIRAISQFLFIYRQDNYKERLQEMYEDYMFNGIETPSNNKLIRKIQREINEKIDDIMKWENKQLHISEFDTKINENAFRCNFRIILIGDTERERKKTIRKFKDVLNEYSYMNDWNVVISKLSEVKLEEVLNRRLNNVGKHDVFSVSELIPFLTIGENKEIEDVRKLEVVKNMERDDINLIEPNISNRNDSLLNMLPKGNLSENTVDMNDYVSKFNNALKKMKLINKGLALINHQIGATLIQMTFKLSNGVRLSTLNKKSVIEDIGMFMGVKGLSIEQSEEMGAINIYIPLEERRKLFLRDYIDTEEFKQFSKESELGFLVGVSMSGEPLYRDLVDGRHLLIGSETGGGKSSFINSVVTTLLLTKNPSELNLYMIDPKLVEFEMYRDFSHVSKIVNNANEGILLLKHLTVEMNRRYKVFQKSGVKDIVQYNKKHPSSKLPHLLIVIDEYSELSMLNKDVHDYVISTSQLGRASGLILILSTQDPRKEVIPPLIKSNMPSKVGFKCSNQYSYQTFLPKRPPKLYGQGHGVLCFAGQSEDFIQFQSCLITDGDEVELLREIASGMNNENNKWSITDVEIVEEVDDDLVKLANLIIETGECRVSKLRENLRWNINKVNDLMKELVDIGVLYPPESRQSGYKLCEGYFEALENYKKNKSPHSLNR